MVDSDTPEPERDFRCNLCNGRIIIPVDLPPTTGPCPHCGGTITSPPLPELADIPIQGEPLAAAIPDLPLPPAPVPEVIPTVAPYAEVETAVDHEQVPPARSQGEIVPPIDLPHPTPKTERISDNARHKEATHTSHGDRDVSKKRHIIPILTVFLLLLALFAAAFYFLQREMKSKPQLRKPTPTVENAALGEDNYLRTGWHQEAYNLLSGYMAATDPNGKLPFILNAKELAPRIKAFYGNTPIHDSDTPAEAFSAYELPMTDKRRGLFMMIFDQPPYFDIKEFFRPLAPMDVQLGMAEPSMLLNTLGQAENFAVEPTRVQVLFKQTPEGLKMDWNVFAQTKYRTFRNFIDLPQPGRKEIFRVLVVEDVPESGRSVPGSRTYGLADPINQNDTLRINVKVDSEAGKALSPINWRGTGQPRPSARTATIELAWTGSERTPELEISRFVCWEFLGIGGVDPLAKVTTP